MSSGDTSRSSYANIADHTLVHALGRRAEASADQHFAQFGEREPLSTAELWDATRRFSTALQRRGIDTGDRVLVSLQSSPEFLIAWFGIGHAGGVMVPLTPSAGLRMFMRAIEHTNPKLAIADSSVASQCAGLRPGMDIVEILDPFGVPLSQEFSDQFIKDFPPNESNAATALGTAAIMFTSGTTGPAKGVALTHAWYAWASEDVAAGMSYGPEDVLYTCLPLGHANAQDTTVGPALLAGSRVVLDERFSASRFWRRVAACKATACNMIANMPRILLDRPADEYVPGHSLRQAFAIPALPAHVSAFQERFDVALRQGYGSTEVGVPVFQGPGSPTGSCGRPVGGTKLRIRLEDGTPAPVGTNGEISVWSPRPGAITHGYWKDPEATARAWSGGWFRTGDTGYVDAEGTLYFTGRLGEVLRRKGQKLATFEIEAVVAAIGGVDDCAAIVGNNQADGEDSLVLYVAPQPGSEVDPAEVVTTCVRELGPAAKPSRVEVRSTLPRTVSGKVAKGQLKASTAVREAGIS